MMHMAEEIKKGSVLRPSFPLASFSARLERNASVDDL
jgi:hypothetical protein